jgi:hypothetical protein
MLLWYPHHWQEEVTIAHQWLATNQPVEFLSRASAANQSTGRVSLPGLGIVIVGYQTKRLSLFLHRMLRPRPPKKACRLPITPIATRHGGRRTRDCSALFLTSVVVELGKKRGQIGLDLLMGRVEKYLVIQNCILEGGAVAHFRLHYAPPVIMYMILLYDTTSIMHSVV